MRVIAKVLFILTLGAAGVAHAAGYPATPTDANKVADFAGIMTPSEKAKIETELHAFNADTKAQIAVVTVDSLDGQDIESYSHGLFKAWGIGLRGADNGVLLLVAPHEKKVRIETGRRIGPYLTDADSSLIIRNVITPRYKSGARGQSIVEGTEAIITHLKPQLAVENKAIMSHAAPKEDSHLGFIILGLIFLSLGIVAGAVLLIGANRRKHGQPTTIDDTPIFDSRIYDSRRSTPAARTEREPSDNGSFVAGVAAGALLSAATERPARQRSNEEDEPPVRQSRDDDEDRSPAFATSRSDDDEDRSSSSTSPSSEEEDSPVSFGGGVDDGGGASGEL